MGKRVEIRGGRFRSLRAAKGQRGFTLIELVLTIVLIGIVSGMGATLLHQGVNAFISEDARANLTDEGRLATERMVREIRMGRGRTAADLPGCCSAATLNFYDIGGNQIIYTRAGATITRNGIVLASADAATLTFSYYQQDGATAAASAAQVWTIQIDLSLTRGVETQAFRVRVHPRNFV